MSMTDLTWPRNGSCELRAQGAEVGADNRSEKLSGLRMAHVSPVLILSAFVFLAGTLSVNSVRAADAEELPEFDCVIEPSEVADLGSAVPGVIGKINVKRNDVVKKGEVVAALESSVENASVVLAKARAELNTSIKLREETAAFGKRTRDRNQTLYRTSSVSQQEIDKLDTENRIAQLQVVQEKDNKRIANLEYRRAKAVLERHFIRTPFDGVVMERYKSVGEFIEDDAVVRVAQLNPLHVEVVLPVEYLGMLSTGRLAKVTPSLPAFASQIGTVTQVDQVADAASGTFGARLSLPNPDHVTPAGLRCRVAFLDPDESLDVVAQEAPVPVSGDESAQMPVPDPTEVVASVADTGTAAGNMADLNSCFRVGPLTDETLASKLSDTIGVMYGTSQSRLELVNDPRNAGYRVLLAAQPDVMAVEDIRANLRDKGIKDLYVVGSGPHKGRISLGYYRKEQNALLQQQSLGARGIEVEVTQEAGRGSAYWINLLFDRSPGARSELQMVAKSVAPGASVQPTECNQQQVTRMD